MNWDSLVQQLGWQDLVNKWNSSEYAQDKNKPKRKNNDNERRKQREGSIELSLCDIHWVFEVEAKNPTQFNGLTYSSEDTLHELSSEQSASDCLSNYGAYFRSLSSLSPSHDNSSESKSHVNTNPFLEVCEQLDSSISSQITADCDFWFYLDPHGCDRGPFGSEEMASWYDSGYFENNLKVRKVLECDYITIGELKKKQRSEMFSTFSLSDLVPEECVEHATTFLNPFRPNLRKTNLNTNNLNQNVAESTNSSAAHTPEIQFKNETYSFNISDEFQKLSLKESTKDTKSVISGETPIKFTLAGPKRKFDATKLSESPVNQNTKTPPKSFLAKLDKAKSFWLDVANTKLVGPKTTIHLEISIDGKMYDAHIEPDSRVSFLGAGSVGFLSENKIELTKYANNSRTIKTNNGRAFKIVGDAFVLIKFRDTIHDLKFLVAPDLESFIYLGSDFVNKFTFNKIQMIPTADHHVSRCIDRRVVTDLTVKQNEQLNEVINTIACIEKSGLGVSNLVSHTIELIDPNNVIPLTCPGHSRTGALGLKVLNKMLDLDIIEPSTSCWELPVVAFCKENDESLCLDLRKINVMIKPDTYPLPDKNEILKLIKASEYTSSLELSSVIWQIPLEIHSRELTAFQTIEEPNVKYQFKRIPYGLKNAHQEVIRLIDKIVPIELRKHCAIDYGQLLVASDDFSTHLEHLRQIAKILSEAKIKINLQKSNFCLKSVKCLGYVIERNSMKVDPAAWRPISIISRPETKQRLKVFLQITDWLQNLIPKYDKIIAPLKLLSKTSNKDLVFHYEAREAFANVKIHLTSDSVICEPVYGHPFYVQCHVNFKIIVGLLYQRGENGEQHPIAYCVKELSTSQEKMTISELECLAAYSCVKHFQRYLEREQFFLITDKSILTWILKQNKLEGMLARWCIELQKYDFSLQQRVQTNNVDFNVLLRVDTTLINEIKSNFTDPLYYCPKYDLLRKQLVNYPHDYPDYKIENNIVFYRREFSCGDPLVDRDVWKIFVPRSMTKSLMQHVHINAFGNHRSRKEMLRYLESAFYWPSMECDLRGVISNCSDCQDKV